MIGGIVQEQDGLLPPHTIFLLQFFHQPEDEPVDGVAVVGAPIEGEVAPAFTANPSNDVDLVEPLGSVDILLDFLQLPGLLPLICEVQSTFINIDDSLAFTEGLNVLIGGILSLEFGTRVVSSHSQLMSLSISAVELLL